MARLVAVCRDGEEDFPFTARQIPLVIDPSLTMVMEFSEDVMNLDSQHINASRWTQFAECYSKLQPQDMSAAMTVTSREVFSALAQLVSCVGCRRSVERLFSQLVKSGTPALEPLSVSPGATLTVSTACRGHANRLFSLLYVHGSKLNDMINAIPKSRKNKRCQLHSLDTHKPKPLGGSWTDVWERMSQECRDEVVLIDSASLLETLEMYLRKHRFCTDCKNKVLRAYSILAGELDCSQETGYCAALYEGLCCCPHQGHVHVCCETNFIAHLLGRAEPEFAGSYERRERHAKTMDVAQEEVLTCLGVHLYERLHRVWQKLRAEEQTWQMLFHLGVDALRRSFEAAVEEAQGSSRLEQLVEELWEEERAKELKQEKKRLKRKKRRKNKCVSLVSEDQQSLDQRSLESADVGCQACGSRDEEEEEEENVAMEVVSGGGGDSCSCLESRALASPKTNKEPHSAASDCGYSSSMEGSETGSRGGEDLAFTTQEPEEEEQDSCLDFWAIAEENSKCKNTKKRKGKILYCDQAPGPEGSGGFRWVPEGSGGLGFRGGAPTQGGALARVALVLPLTTHEGTPGPEPSGPPDPPSRTLAELLGEAGRPSECCLTQEEIQAFVKRHESFYRRRDQYRQLLRDRFTSYCRAAESG